MGWSPWINENERVNWGPKFISLCLLVTDARQHKLLMPCLPYHDGLHSQTVSQSKSFFIYAAFVAHCVTTMRNGKKLIHRTNHTCYLRTLEMLCRAVSINRVQTTPSRTHPVKERQDGAKTTWANTRHTAPCTVINMNRTVGAQSRGDRFSGVTGTVCNVIWHLSLHHSLQPHS